MLRITVELVPYGDESNTKKIGEMVIANDTKKSSGGMGAYEAWRSADDWTKAPVMFARLNAFDRSQSVWELIAQIAHAMNEEGHVPDESESSLSQRLKKRLSK